jgi:hypothetical protein
MQFLTNNTERMRIDSSGNLLVGTTTARNRLTVQGTVFSTPTLGTASGQGFFGEAAGYGMMLGTSGFGYGWIQQQRVDGSATPYDLLLQPVGGNVGIGTTAPSQRVSVGASSGTVGYGIEYTPTDQQVFSLTANLATGEVRHFADTNYFPTFYANNTERMRIDSSGRMGINSSAPGTILQASDPTNAASSSTITRGSNFSGLTLTTPNNGNNMVGVFFGTGPTTAGSHWSGITGNRSDAASHWGTHLSFYTHSNDFSAIDNANERMRIDGNGNVVIGNTAAPYVTSGRTVFAVNGSSSTLMALQTAGSNRGYLYADGSLLTLEAEPGCTLSFRAIGAQPMTFFTSNTERMRISSGGILFLGTTTGGGIVNIKEGSTNFEINTSGVSADLLAYDRGASAYKQLKFRGSIFTFEPGDVEKVRISAVGGFSVGTTADPGAGAIYATGNITAYYSDDRLKTRLGDIDDALGIIDKIDAFYYEANETAKGLGYEAVREVGVSAQSVQKVLPEVVAPAPIDAEYLTVRYERLVPVLIQAIKELTARVAQLEGK